LIDSACFEEKMSIFKLGGLECMCLNGGRRLDQVFEAFGDVHSLTQSDDEREPERLKFASDEVHNRIRERGGWCGHFGLAENTEQFYSEEPQRFGGIEWDIHRFLWRPWLTQFREGRWIAKGRALEFSAERNEIPSAFFYSHVEFDMSRSAIEEIIDTGKAFIRGSRYVDVLIYSREYLEHQAQLPRLAGSEVAQAQTEPVRARGGRPQVKSLDYAFYCVIARYRREGLPESKTKLIDDILQELSNLNE
jgi:hypothetical protein